MDIDAVVEALRDALGTERASVILRSEAAVAEVRGPLGVRRGEGWLTLGEEGGSHLHVKIGNVDSVHFRRPDDGNAALEVLGTDRGVLLRVTFRGTNPARPANFDAGWREQVVARFGHLAG